MSFDDRVVLLIQALRKSNTVSPLQHEDVIYALERLLADNRELRIRLKEAECPSPG